jgi:hypothetical protein
LGNTVNIYTRSASSVLDLLSDMGAAYRSLHDQVLDFVTDPMKPDSAKALEFTARELVRLAPRFTGKILSGKHIDTIFRCAAFEMRYHAKLQIQSA